MGKNFHKAAGVPCTKADCPICKHFASEAAIKAALWASGRASKASKKVIRKARLAARRLEGEQRRKALAARIRAREELLDNIVAEVMGPAAGEAP